MAAPAEGLCVLQGPSASLGDGEDVVYLQALAIMAADTSEAVADEGPGPYLSVPQAPGSISDPIPGARAQPRPLSRGVITAPACPDRPLRTSAHETDGRGSWHGSPPRIALVFELGSKVNGSLGKGFGGGPVGF